MPHRDHDPDDEDWYDDEDDDPADAFPCPECGSEIYADLDHCPRCGHWLTDSDRNLPRVGLFDSRTTRIVAILLLAIFVLSLLASILAL